MRAPVAEPDSLDAKEFLELVAGERCPCGHTRAEHDTRPTGEFGPCFRCQCGGLIQRQDEEEPDE